MRHLLAMLFLVVFTLQVVPIKSISKMLCKQSTEEVQADAPGDDIAGSDVPAFYYSDIILSRYSFDPVAGGRHMVCKASGIIGHTEDLPSAFINSIPSPPPDFI